jgi:hypothetical protein
MKWYDRWYLSFKTLGRTLRFSGAGMLIMILVNLVCSLSLDFAANWILPFFDPEIGVDRFTFVFLAVLTLNCFITVAVTFGSLYNSIRISTLKNQRFLGISLALGASEKDLDRIQINQVMIQVILASGITFGLSFLLAPLYTFLFNTFMSSFNNDLTFTFHWWIGLIFSGIYLISTAIAIHKKAAYLHWITPAQALKEDQ